MFAWHEHLKCCSLCSHTYFDKEERKKTRKKRKKKAFFSGRTWRFVKVFGVLFDTLKKLKKIIKKNGKTRRARP